METLRDVIYPLGFVANILFALRFTIQWFISEFKKKSVVGPSFWMISLVANSLMVIHTIIQLQLNICLIQTFNAVISWRNLDLRKEKSKQASLRTVFLISIFSFIFVFSLFLLQGWFSIDGQYIFLRSPTYLAAGVTLSTSWHLFGTVGFALFASRFWVQWWQSEMARESVVHRSFWWLSIGGALMSCTYFFMLNDLVNFIGPALGMIPYIRNLMLIKNKSKSIERS